ncbi:MAG: chromate efflux transporter [Thermomicrobiales bacterium]
MSTSEPAHETATPREELTADAPGGLREVAALMFRLGWTAFGGPAAHIAMLRGEVVKRRRWMTEQRFLDIIGAANLVPGPTSTQTVMHSGYARAGWPGLFVGGTLFILPAAFLVLVFAWLYVRYGTTTGGVWLLYGIKPVIIAVVVQALWGLGRTAVKNLLLGAVGGAVFAGYLLGLNVILLLFGAAIFIMLIENARRIGTLRRAAHTIVPLPALKTAALFGVAAGATVAYSPLRLFLTFLKIGSVLYGSGYVLLAFLRNDFVNHLGWLTNQQLLDAVAVGQFTPGPVFTTATFIGYLVGGFQGAVVATLGIFLPAFVFVALSVPILPHLRKSPWTAAALDGVNVAAVGLMAGVAWELGRAAVGDWFTALLALVTAFLLIRFRVNSVWLVLGGGVAGILYHVLV